MGDKTRGLYEKFDVIRTDGKSEPGQKHEGCDYFVLDKTHDKFAVAAMIAYAQVCEKEYPQLANDICAEVMLMIERFPEMAGNYPRPTLDAAPDEHAGTPACAEGWCERTNHEPDCPKRAS